MTNWDFPCPEPATISVSSWASGSVAVSGEETDTISVEIVSSRGSDSIDDLLSEIRVEFDHGRLSVSGPRMTSFRRRKGLDLTIKAPAGSGLEVRTASADISCVGRLGRLNLHTASGDVTIASALGPVEVETASGDVFVGDAAIDVMAKTASGDVRVARAGGEVRISAASGDVAVADPGGPVAIRTASGDIQVRDFATGLAELNAVSGDVSVTVVQGLGVFMELSSLSGSVRSDLDASTDGTDEAGEPPEIAINCRTISGDIRISKGRAKSGLAPDAA